jgi:hypothetical protein
MNVFSRKNALIGFVTLKALEQRLKRRKRRSRARRIAALGIGIVSLGALAGLAVLLLRRHGSDEPAAGAESDDEIVGEVVTAAAEPIPAT